MRQAEFSCRVPVRTARLMGDRFHGSLQLLSVVLFGALIVLFTKGKAPVPMVFMVLFRSAPVDRLSSAE